MVISRQIQKIGLQIFTNGRTCADTGPENRLSSSFLSYNSYISFLYYFNISDLNILSQIL